MWFISKYSNLAQPWCRCCVHSEYDWWAAPNFGPANVCVLSLMHFLGDKWCFYKSGVIRGSDWLALTSQNFNSRWTWTFWTISKYPLDFYDWLACKISLERAHMAFLGLTLLIDFHNKSCLLSFFLTNTWKYALTAVFLPELDLAVCSAFG